MLKGLFLNTVAARVAPVLNNSAFSHCFMLECSAPTRGLEQTRVTEACLAQVALQAAGSACGIWQAFCLSSYLDFFGALPAWGIQAPQQKWRNDKLARRSLAAAGCWPMAPRTA